MLHRLPEGGEAILVRQRLLLQVAMEEKVADRGDAQALAFLAARGEEDALLLRGRAGAGTGEREDRCGEEGGARTARDRRGGEGACHVRACGDARDGGSHPLQAAARAFNL